MLVSYIVDTNLHYIIFIPFVRGFSNSCSLAKTPSTTESNLQFRFYNKENAILEFQFIVYTPAAMTIYIIIININTFKAITKAFAFIHSKFN